MNKRGSTDSSSNTRPAGIAPPPEVTSRRRRTRLYIEALGLRRGLWFSLRESLGDTREVSVTRGHRRIAFRLGTSDIIVWFSVLTRKDYEMTLPRNPRTIVDAGAYIGLSAIYFAERYPEAAIVAVEPEPSNFALLVRNTKSFANIVPLNCALWSEDGEVDLYARTTGHWAYSIGVGAHSPRRSVGRVKAVSMNTLLTMLGAGQLGLLKIDVEGAEKDIFAHAAGWIHRIDTILAELHDRFVPGCKEAFLKATIGFRHDMSHPMTVYSTNRLLDSADS